jgi:F420-non-reducing hydrogenase iron-sulfur subunit
MLRRVLEQLGLEPELLRLDWVSASKGDKFATVIKDMRNEIKKLGPSPLRAGGKIRV